MSKTINQYCRQCGEKLTRRIVPGESVEVHMMDSGGGCWYDFTAPFDPKTGEPKMVEVYQCPQYKRRWWGENSHDIFALQGEIVEWGVRVKS